MGIGTGEIRSKISLTRGEQEQARFGYHTLKPKKWDFVLGATLLYRINAHRSGVVRVEKRGVESEIAATYIGLGQGLL